MRLLPVRSGHIEILAYAPDGSHLAASARPWSRVWLWDLQAGDVRLLKEPLPRAPLAPAPPARRPRLPDPLARPRPAATRPRQPRRQPELRRLQPDRPPARPGRRGAGPALRRRSRPRLLRHGAGGQPLGQPDAPLLV